ncbi:MAG: inositol monophosphatase [Acidobacteria bacterium]|nr:inositol monophosphatase [Acidobacteriota bacterium]
MDINEFAAVGTEAAKQAGQYALDRLRTDFSVEHKGTINLVTEVDIAAEEMIVTRLQERFPDHSILAEEKNNETRGGACTWVIDPLDGTTNYAHGFPFFSVSIGLEISGKVLLGIVYDPVRDELFTARKGSGAFCNNEPLHVSKTESLNAGLLATGFPYDIRTSEQNNLKNFCAFALRCQGVRRTGSAALDLCYVAAGRIDGFWESKLNPWDCAAGYLLVSEAGGLVTDYIGGSASIYKAEVVASNGRIHKEMLDVIKTVGSR